MVVDCAECKTLAFLQCGGFSAGRTAPVLLPAQLPILTTLERKKKVGIPRFSVEFNKVNQNAVMDAYLTPTIQEIMESLAGNAVSSSLDLNSGYWQEEMDQGIRNPSLHLRPGSVPL